MNFDVKDTSLAPEGVKRIRWADERMPVLASIRERFAEEKPLDGERLSACMHITTETANLARTLKAGGADVVLCASNPLSTQDNVAAALVEEYDIPVFAIRGEDQDTYYEHITKALDHEPNMTMDDGADLVTAILTERTDLAPNIKASMEETTTGVIRLRAMEDDGALKFPVFAVNDAHTKHLFDNRHGTGQSTVDGIMRATGLLMAGKTVVVAGYGMCGRGVAKRMDGMGANVIVTETDPLRALEAAMEGFTVCPMDEAAPRGDIFVTVTGNKHVLRREHFEKMKDGAMLANAGHFNVEINLDQLDEMAANVDTEIKDLVTQYEMDDGRKLNVLGEGRLINLAAAEGHPACVMDMSFAVQSLCAEYVALGKHRDEERVFSVPDEIDEQVAALKLDTMGTSIDELTDTQKEYLGSWREGT